MVMFGTVAVIGIQTLSRVDFHDDRNVIIVAVTLGLALIPVAFPTFYRNFDNDVQQIIASGITMGALSAILLNLFLNILAGKRNFVDEVEPTMQRPERLSIEQVNGLCRATSSSRRSARCSRASRGSPPKRRASGRSTACTPCGTRSRAALFDAPAERQLDLIRAYPDLAAKIALGPGSTRDQASAGLNRLSPDEYERFDALNEAYRAKFGFPFVICVRENTKETIFARFERRLENTPKQERVAALVEIAKIANLRLLDQVEEPESPSRRRPGRAAARATVRPRARREREGTRS